MFKLRLNRIVKTLALSLCMLGFMMASSTSYASKINNNDTQIIQDTVSMAGCTWSYAQATQYHSNYGVYSTQVKQTSTACGHIYVQHYTSGCVSARLRYFPSSGGTFVSSWQSVCNGSWTYFSTNVLAGTIFRVETTTQNAQFAIDY